MNMRISELTGSNTTYFDRVPEKLVLEGYRRWTAGFETGSVIPWEMTWTLYTDILGVEGGKKLVAELSQFIRVLRHCAICPLRAFPFDSRHVCREECLTLGLVSGLQNEDGVMTKACLEAMACKSRCDDVAGAARSFADALAEFGQTLLPIPVSTIDGVINRVMRTTFH